MNAASIYESNILENLHIITYSALLLPPYKGNDFFFSMKTAKQTDVTEAQAI